MSKKDVPQIPIDEQVEAQTLYQFALTVETIKLLTSSQDPERSWDIFCRRYGLNGYEQHTTAKIAREYGLDKQRINQLLQKTLRNLRYAYRRN